tara:strand:+ start:390 stop:857 length:468 start_codon:yes stop_codon:yes gene_type:complete
MSTLSVDTITGKSTSTNLTIGSTPVVSSSANSLTIRGEGSAQTSIQQGLAKAWFTMDGTTTSASESITPIDSFNIGGITDEGQGDYSHTYSSNIGTAKHPITGSVIGSAEANFFAFITSTGTAQATTGDAFQIIHHTGVDADQDPIHIIVHGDLA